MDKDVNFFQNYFTNNNCVQQLKLSVADIQNLSLLIKYRLIHNRRIINIITHTNHKSSDKDKNIGNNRCLARIHNGNQCSRKCKNNNVEPCSICSV